MTFSVSGWQATDESYVQELTSDDLLAAWDDLHVADLADQPDGELLDAWLLFHNGHYAEAANQAFGLGAPGSEIVMRAVVAYTDYICEDEDECTNLLEQAYLYGESQCDAPDANHNTWFTTALAMGRYSQSISITKALTKGLGGKVKNSLTQVLEQQPEHAEAHLAMGMYHAEIIDKVGATLGGLTYGAKAKTAVKHIDQALNFAPNAINLIEAGNAELLLKGESKGMDRATELYQAAAEYEAMDCLQLMDVDFAASQLQE